MDESEENMSSDDRKNSHPTLSVKTKPKKRSLVERELETSLTARVTSPVTSSDGSSTSRYGRARRLKTDIDYCDTDKAVSNALRTSRIDKSPVKSPPAYKMHATNSPVQTESPHKNLSIENKLENQIEHIYNANISLSRFGSEEKKNLTPSPAKKFPKIYMRKDMIQTKEKVKEKEETITLIKNMFSPVKQYKPTTTNNHLSNILERSSEKYNLNGVTNKPLNGLIDPSSVVKMLDFDNNKKKKENRESKPVLSKSDLFDLEAKCEYQVGDLAWARMGTYPFWPCIITREPTSETFVRKKLFGRIERNIIHVTFFGDNGRRSWIVDSMLRKFLGRLEFEAARDRFTPEAKKKDPRLYAAFFISEKKQGLWNTSVEEAETLLREPKRLRIDHFYDLLRRTMTVKPSSKTQKVEKHPKIDEVPKLAKVDSDVSLSESLFDTLFSEDDGKADDNDRLRTIRKKSLDVSEVVTACLDNMAAKTGITKIQRQSHMDRWLQKAKSKTPEKSQFKVTVTVEKVDEKNENVREKERDVKVKNSKKKKKVLTKVGPTQKPYSFRKPSNESRNLLSHHNEHDYSCKYIENMENCYVKLDKSKPIVHNAIANLSKDLPLNDVSVFETTKTDCDKTCNDEMECEGLITAVENNDSFANHDKAEHNNLANMNNEETSKLETLISDPPCSVIKADQSIKDQDIPPKIETLKNDVACSEMDVDQSLNEENVNSPKNDTEANDGSCPKMEVDQILKYIIPPGIKSVMKDVSCPVLDVTESTKDVNIFPTEESKIRDLLVLPDNLNGTKSNLNLIYEHSEIIDVDNKRTERKNNKIAVDAFDKCIDTVVAEKKQISENSDECIDKDSDATTSDCNVVDAEKPIDDDITNFRNHVGVTISKVAVTGFDRSIDTVVAEKTQIISENFNKCIDKDSNTTNSDFNVDDTEIPTDDDITNCGNDVGITVCKMALAASDSSIGIVVAEKILLPSENFDKYKDSNTTKSDCNVADTEMPTDDDITDCGSDIHTTVLDSINKILSENETKAITSEKEIKQNDATNQVKDKVCCKAEEYIQCTESESSVQELNKGDLKSCESIENNFQDEVLNGNFEKSTCEEKIVQPVDIKNDSQDTKAIESTETPVVKHASLNGEINKTDDCDQPPSNHKRDQNETTQISNNLVDIVSINSIEPLKGLAIEARKDKLELDNVSTISQVSDIPIKEPFSNGTSEPMVYVKDYMERIKNELLQDSDTASVCSELDEVTLNEINLPPKSTIINERSKLTENISKTLYIDKDKTKFDVPITVNQTESNGCLLPKIVKIASSDNSSNVLDSKVSIKKRSLRLRKSNSPSVMKENGFHDSKGSSPERAIKEEFDPETISMNSEDSNVSVTKLKSRRNSNVKTEDRTQDPKFLKYLEATQDALMDEHQELTHEEIVAYLYKSWSYKESCVKKTLETEESHELQNVIEQSSPPKKVKKRINNEKKKLIDIEKALSKESKKLNCFVDNIPRDKPKRKIVKPYYNEDFSDIEDEIKMFEIFKKEPKTEPNMEVPTTSNVSKAGEDAIVLKIKTETTRTDNHVDISPEEYYDEVEAYFKELTQPKPNVFKGLVREKVCEICEKTTNLVKCKKCSSMFHVECVQKEAEVIEIPAPVKVRGRKKKKKPRGCKPKTSTDSNGLDSESQSDEKSQDLNASDEQNMSIDETKEPDCYIVADAETFEAQLAIKMKELLETTDNVEYDSYSSDDGLDWSGTVAGKCEIVDIKLKPKRVENTDYSDFKCNSCQKYDTPICFVCKQAVSPKNQSENRQRCQVPHCHKYYHLQCLEQWPQTQFNSGEPSRIKKKIDEYFEALTCPRHVCHTCVCDDPRGCKTRFSGDKLARCVRCPATYHSFTKCLPAGTQILTASHIICPRHYKHRPGKVPCHVNTGWCFICALGGSLICCEYCPTSFHAECLNISPPEGGYMCEDCETGRLPLYGEMVWVKLGHYRWWPGIVLHPCEVPANIMAVKHTPGEFVVRFFGQYDHYWVNRGRVFPFQEGDSGRISSQKSKIDEAFTLAIEHAQRAFEILKNTKSNEEESIDIASSLLPPHYVKLKVNKPCGSLCGRRVDIEESSLTQCECNPDEEDPCGPYSHCLNRMLLTECGPSCRAGERCNNRAFEKRLYPKLVPYRTPHRGWGLKTLQDIKAGQFVIEYVGELIDEAEFRRRMRRKHEVRDENFYFLTLDKERMIDAGPKGNLARFMNHCCEPNCETQKWTVLGDVRVGLFALRDIPANSEVTFNYNLECAGIEKKRCMCGAKRCSGYIGAKPKQDESQPKKPKLAAKRLNKKRKMPEDSPSTSKSKPKRPVGRPRIEKPRELTEIEKDLLIIKNAINGLSSDSECSGRLSSIDVESEKKDAKALKRKRVDFSADEVGVSDSSLSSPSVKKVKMDVKKTNYDVGD